MRLLVLVLITLSASPILADPQPLPVPPSGQLPAQYAAWLHTLSPQLQRRIEAHCRANPDDVDEVCGGIGPLHIPPPPTLGIAAGVSRIRAADAWEAWWRSLNGQQRRYVRRHCRNVTEATVLCGGTPLVVAFDDRPVEYTIDVGFALVPGAPRATDWPTAVTPWIALDRDGDGAIRSGAELFGSATPLPDGSIAADGFAALAALDANHDGVIDRRDPAFASLLLWRDRDGDGASTPSELSPLAAEIDAISLEAADAPRCTARLDCERERSAMSWHDAGGAAHTGAVIDVHLPAR
jgi:hypothetical protein